MRQDQQHVCQLPGKACVLIIQMPTAIIHASAFIKLVCKGLLCPHPLVEGYDIYTFTLLQVLDPEPAAM